MAWGATAAGRRLAATALVVLAWLAAAPARAKDDLVIGVAQFPSSLHPNIDPEVIKSYILGFALRPMTAFDADWKNTCMLCTELPSLQNGMVRLEDQPGGAHGMAVKVTLRNDLVWGDGAPITTADLAFTAKVGRDPNSGFANTRTWTRIASVDVIDATTAVLHLNEIDALYDRLPNLLPEHIEAPVFANATGPGAYGRLTNYNRAPTTPGLYNGPYRLTVYQSGVGVVLEPNPRWIGTKAGFRRIVVKAIENTAALQANLLSGDVDMAPGDAPSLTIDQVLTLRKQQPDRFNYVFRPALTYEHIDLNLDNPILADLRVRRALLHALDRKTLTDRLFEGLQPVADSFVNPQDPMHSDDVPRYGYDPARARSLLAEAGWRPDADGICRNAARARLTLEFQTTSGNMLRELQQQVLQNQWKAACVDIVIKNEPARTFFGDTLKRRQFGALAMYAWTTGISFPPRQTLASDQIPTAANAYGGSNYMDFRDAIMDAAIKTAETELDREKREAAWAEMQKIYATQLPALPLFFRAEAYVLPKWLKGVTPTGHADFSSLWAENWRSE
jgi:peptide/nickel transport system substrate-binding protein